MKRLSKVAVVAFLQNALVKAKMSGDTKAAIQSGSASLNKSVLYIRKNIAIGGGTIKLVDPNTKELTGISSFDGNRLPKYVNQFFAGISLGYAADAAADKEAALVYATAFPPSLRNAELRIVQDGETIVSLPVAELDSATVAGVSTSDRYVDLGGTHMLREEKPFSIELEFPTGAAGGGTNDYVEVCIEGISTAEAN